jgi:hypothetical protein
MDATVIYDLRQAQDLAYPTTFSLLGIAMLMLLAWGVLYPFRARVNTTMFGALRPMALTLCGFAVGAAAFEHHDVQTNLALADAFDAGKGVVVEGAISQIKPPREVQTGKITSWHSGSFDVDGRLVFYEHSMPVEVAFTDGDHIKVYTVGEVIVRIEKIARN